MLSTPAPIQTFWTIDLVAADRHEVYVASVNIERYFADGLSSVSVKENLPCPT